MQKFVLFRPPGSLGPDFNEAAQLLKSNPHVLGIDGAQHEDTAGMALVQISTDDDVKATADSLAKTLPGWNIGHRNGGAWGKG